MFDIYFVIFILLFSFLCLIEFIVFNEEILLALCFLSFIFFCLNTLSDSVYDNFASRASKFESDLLISYSSTKQLLIAQFESSYKLRGFSSKFKLLLSSILIYLNSSKSYSAFNLSSNFVAAGSSKLNELVLLDNKLFVSFQENCISTLLYPLIFQTVKTSTFLTYLPATTKQNFTTSAKILKSFSY